MRHVPRRHWMHSSRLAAPSRKGAGWIAVGLVGACLLGVGVGPASAQEEGPEPTAAPTATPAASPDAAAARTPLPIMVAVLPARRVSDDAVETVRASVVATVTPMAGGRPVHALSDASMLETLDGCDDEAPCIGALLASARAQGGLLVGIRRARTGYAVRLELRDPVSGALRGEPVEGDLPRDVDAFHAALTPLVDQLQASLPSPPPPPSTLLVTVNVDGANIQLDGQPLGESPVAAVEVSEGPHTVSVMAPGHAPAQRRTEIAAGEQARLDITLDPLGHEVAAASGGSVGEGAWQMDTSDSGDAALVEQWWFWTAIGGGVAVVITAIAIGVAVANEGPSMLDPQGIELPPLMGGL